jgi:nitrogen fixation/metabolism regulation signal transduction histidine kinase
MKHPASRRISPELRQALITLASNLIPSMLVLVCLGYLQVSLYLWILVAVLLGFLTMFSIVSVWRTANFQFRSLHNLLEAMVKGNYTLRGVAGDDGSYGKLVTVINDLADTLHKQRMQSEEKQLLLLKVINQIEVAILAWDDSNRIQLMNPAAGALLNLPNERPEEMHPGKDVVVLPLAVNFANDMPVGKAQLRDLEFGNKRGKYVLFKERFIADGNTHHLLFMTNIAGILREEEKKAWQNLIRVLSHEINNSLTPLNSLSRSLIKQVELREQDETLARELINGMSIIGKRAETLTNFLQNYKKLTSLPEPVLAPVNVEQLVTGVCTLFAGQNVSVSGAPVIVKLDAAQMEQVLINLLKNAVEANESATAIETRPDSNIDITWYCAEHQLTLLISDTGDGLASTENLFTPFYTTKTKGSGIGLSLCRQIVEAHRGQLSLENRKDRSGCTVSIVLPLLQEENA